MDYATRDDLNGLGQRVNHLETSCARYEGKASVEILALQNWIVDIDKAQKGQAESIHDLEVTMTRQSQEISDKVSETVSKRVGTIIAIASILILTLQIAGIMAK